MLLLERKSAPFGYEIKKFGINKHSRGGKMSRSKRSSFVDEIADKNLAPGPGSYTSYTEFAHYKKHKHSLTKMIWYVQAVFICDICCIENHI